ncbi:hypothetical protein TRAPUB_9164 [Trametes pubescens]|uniref:Uncharacterized protein n=1 Tax=Trametes pubescens TaxID=154538 RepID=A0A1M2W365_TRAPU|nr:hypothetical protein TRAPUB_9164 [Trametes pubescens]
MTEVKAQLVVTMQGTSEEIATKSRACDPGMPTDMNIVADEKMRLNATAAELHQAQQRARHVLVCVDLCVWIPLGLQDSPAWILLR